MDGLIIKKEWLDLIMIGEKTLEIRGHNTKKLNEQIYLLESGTHRIRGVCTIKSSVLMHRNNWEQLKQKHCVNISFLSLNKIYKTAYGWGITDVQPIYEELYYEHKKGTVIWVKNVVLVKKIKGV